jgi:putative copper export protein
MHVLTIDLEVVRLTLHVLAATIWVGGQIVLAALVGPLRKAAPAAVAPAARAFAWVAWPAFTVLILTGGWMLSGGSQESAEWRTTLTIKLALVLVSGIGAAMHTLVKNPVIKGTSAGIGLLSALAVVLLGVALAQA